MQYLATGMPLKPLKSGLEGFLKGVVGFVVVLGCARGLRRQNSRSFSLFKKIQTSGSQPSERASAIDHGQFSGKVSASRPVSLLARVTASPQTTSSHSESLSFGFRLGTCPKWITTAFRCVFKVLCQLELRRFGWYFHLSKWARSTAIRLASSRFSLFPTSSISSAIFARSSWSKRPARSSAACSLAHATTSAS